MNIAEGMGEQESMPQVFGCRTEIKLEIGSWGTEAQCCILTGRTEQLGSLLKLAETQNFFPFSCSFPHLVCWSSLCL